MDESTYQEVSEQSIQDFWTCPIVHPTHLERLQYIPPRHKFPIISYEEFMKIPEHERVYYSKSSHKYIDILRDIGQIYHGYSNLCEFSLDPVGISKGHIFELGKIEPPYLLK